MGLVEKVGALMVDPKFGLSASVYTELTDCEAEINGFITYDRQVRFASFELARCAVPNSLKQMGV